MDISSILGGMGGGMPENAPPKAPNTPFEYTAQAISPLVNGEVELTIDEKNLTVSSLFDIAEVPFADINLLSLADYVVKIETDSETYEFSRMGSFCEPFYNALSDEYNNAVLRSLFVNGSPVLTAKGNFEYTENGITVSGSASVYVYENCVTVLPPDLSARRVPLCFVNGLTKGDYTLTLTLDTGESYTFSKLGYDTAPFEAAIEKQIRALREKSLSAIKEIEPTLTATQTSQISKIMPEGAAAPIGKLAAIAPSFVEQLDTMLLNTPTAEYYTAFKEMCDPAQIYIGFQKKMSAETVDEITAEQEISAQEVDILQTSADETTDEPTKTSPYLLWMIVPSPNGQFAAVEFAEENSATYVYRTDGDFKTFAHQLNRALEAISFKRDVIRLTDDELKKPEYINYYTASKRTAALQFVRSRFAGRVIHNNLAAWKSKLNELWSM